ncbi:uncharacterized protein [Onthophagus taurus]|uniref:uncharacterized protein n=1 Tax=Onthophagus taurus TaxID=166361 RepID=UPI0039BE3212
MGDIYASKTITLDRGSYTQCTLNLYGANITSWRIRNIEQLFVSTQAIADGKLAIRGGIPIVFPQYGPWQFGPHHGFARLMEWKIKQHPKKLENRDIEAIVYLEADYYSRSMWNFSFKAEYQIILQEYGIKLSITVFNQDKESLNFNLLMHPYIQVPNMVNTKIVGLEGEFWDKTTDNLAEGVPIMKIYEFTDRVYKNTRSTHILTNVMENNKMKIEKENCPDTVIWNPGSENAKKFIDLLESEYARLICLATGHADQHLKVLPNESSTMKLSMHIMRDDILAELQKLYQRSSESDPKFEGGFIW